MKTVPEQAGKILRLALNRAASDGEWRAAAVKFISALREARTEPEDILESARSEKAETGGRPYFMPFGKHKGKTLRDIPLDYLLWLTENIELRYPLEAAVMKEIKSRK